ncbi:MAG: hypothetical protein U0414_27120 [Polyangiaceae bacterium]
MVRSARSHAARSCRRIRSIRPLKSTPTTNIIANVKTCRASVTTNS